MPELLSAFLDDPGTSIAFAYLEGTPDARRLLDVGRKSLETGKPVMIWKAATTEAGIKAAASHTANMTGSYDLYRAALRQAGLIEVDDVEPIVDIAKLFAQGRLPQAATRSACCRSPAAPASCSPIAAVQGGLTLPPFSEATLAALRKVVPSYRLAREPRRRHRRRSSTTCALHQPLEIVLADPGIDQLSILLASICGPPPQRAARPSPPPPADRQAGACGLVGPARQVGRGRDRTHRGRACRSSPRRYASPAPPPPSPASPMTAAACCRAGRREVRLPHDSCCRPAP